MAKICRSEEVFRFAGLIVSIARKFPTTPVCSQEDYIQVGFVAAIKALNSFNSNRNTKLSSYIGVVVFRAIKIYFIKNKHHLKISERDGKWCYQIQNLSRIGLSDDDICIKLKISKKRLESLKNILSVMNTYTIYNIDESKISELV